jgi:hypothetical protein
MLGVGGAAGPGNAANAGYQGKPGTVTPLSNSWNWLPNPSAMAFEYAIHCLSRGRLRKDERCERRFDQASPVCGHGIDHDAGERCRGVPLAKAAGDGAAHVGDECPVRIRRHPGRRILWSACFAISLMRLELGLGMLAPAAAGAHPPTLPFP